ncbi:HET-domain-containing [Fusarium albosuccineum]|uniref:HET-domain-containing n=1 Tax=Fusarium albosuccineum TaxID=1237068 RepID=A0A8H4PFX6_9HYPO|nr:HET-domain-containing [Fusarium albosuccineum]
MSAFETAHHCTHCQKRFLIRDNGEPRPLYYVDDDPKSKHYSKLWPPDDEPVTLSEIRLMARDGCEFAEYLAQNLISGEGQYPDDAIVKRVPPHQTDGEPNSVIVRLSGRDDSETNCFFTYMAEQESTAAHEVLQRPPNLDPASVDAFDLARKWVQECFYNHSSCENPHESFMPTRIIEISPSGESIRICTDIPPAPYAVLSYCWGGPQRITLTKSRVQASQLSFATDTLPRTLRDAIRVCRELGLRYLWVDALCIIQDDPEDKGFEIGNMASIYQNSYVAIMASRAKGVEEGFLHPRAPFGAGDDCRGFRLPYRSEDGSTGSVILIEESVSQAYIDPLADRAWAFQEFVLSPRILDYGELRTTWICQIEDKPTDGFSSPPISCWSRQRFHELTSPMLETTTESPHQLWSTLVQCYMASSLTIPSDRLPALAGIAERFNTVVQDEYLAGCWKSRICLELMWWQEGGRLRTRGSEYLAPSWSWASIPFGDFHYIATRSCHAEGGFELLGHDIQVVYQTGRYGAVASGFLEVRGRVLPDHCLPSFGIPTNSANVDVPGHYPLSVSCSMTPDPLLPGFDSKCPTIALCLCWDEKRAKIWGLVVWEMKPGCFMRVGIFSAEGRIDIFSTEVPYAELSKAQDDSKKAWREGLSIKRMKIF